MFKKLLINFRKNRKTRLIGIIAIIAIIAPLAINTLLNSVRVKADSFFKLDEGYGTTSAANDSSGAVSAGSITGAIWKTDDMCFDGKCLYFDGDGDFVSFADDADLDFAGSDSFSLMGWFRHSHFTHSVDIDHEDGTNSEYDSAETDSGDLSVSSTAALNGTGYGLSVNIDDTNSIYGQYDLISANTSGVLRARFYLDPNSVTMANFDLFSMLYIYNSSSQPILQLDLAYNDTDGYALRPVAQNDSGGGETISYQAITDSPHVFEVELKRAINNSSSDGSLTFWVDGSLIWSKNTIDNYDRFFDFYRTRFGAPVGLDAGTLGTFYLDELEIYTDVPQTILAKYETTGGDGGYKVYFENDGDVVCGIDNDNSGFPSDSVSSTTANYDNNRWHHFACVKNGSGSLSLYVDTLPVGTDSSITSSTLVNNDSFYIGIDGDGASNDYQGFIDEIKVYRSAKTASEIKGDYVKSSTLGGTSASFGIKDQSYLSDGLVGYWEMDEISTETSLEDLSGNNNDGNINLWGGGNTATASARLTGKFGGGIDFDGVDDFVSVPYSSVFNINDELTLSFWVNPDSSSPLSAQYAIGHGWHYYVYFNGSSNEFKVMLRNSSGEYEFFGSDFNVPQSEWTHLSVTFKNRLVSFYVNGQLKKTGNFTTDLLYDTAGNPVTIGAYHQGTFPNHTGEFEGKLDDARIYNRALSPAEVANLYNWAPGPVAHWKLDENAGTNAYDSSGNGNNSTTWTGDVSWATGKSGSGLYFDGDDDVVRIAESTSTDLGSVSASLTVEAWFKTSANYSDSAVIVTKCLDCSTYVWPFSLFLTSEEHVRFYDSSTWVTSTSAYNDGKWHHAAGVKDVSSNTFSLYVDGVLAEQKANSDTNDEHNNADISIGNAGTDSLGYDLYDFNGSIDDVRIYNYARTPSQIVQDMNAGHPAPGSPVGSSLGEWSFDEGYGDTANNTGNGGTSLNGNMAGTGGSCPGAAACPTWTNEGKYGKALSFDGGDYVSMGDVDVLDFDYNQPFSFSFWLKPDNFDNYRTFISKRNGSYVGYWFGYHNGDGHIAFNQINTTVSNTRGSSWVNSPPAGTWTHVILTNNGVDDDGILLYYNGILQNKSSTVDTLTATTKNDSNFTIGVDSFTSSSDYYDGLIDDVKIYNFVLTPDQVKLSYNQGQMAVMGSLSTDSSGNASWSATDSHCPPGQTTSCTGPVGWWKLDEGNGTYAYDSSGNDFTSTLYNNIPRTIGKYGGALQTLDDDVVQYAETSDHDELDFDNTQDYTISAWVKFGPTGNYYLFARKIGDSPTRGYYLGAYSKDDIWCSYRYDLNIDEANATVPDNEWHYLTCLMDRNGTITGTSGLYIYVDGVQKDSDTSLQAINGVNTGGLRIGDNSSSFEGNSQIDNLKIYNYARTPAQIAWDMNRGAPIAQYDFDECSGTTLNDVAPKSDKDSAGYDGTIYPGTLAQTEVGDCLTNADTLWYDGRTGKYSSSLALDGSDDYVGVPDNDVFSFGNASSSRPFTLSAWIKANNWSQNVILAKSDHTTGNQKREYLMFVTGEDYLVLNLYDETTDGYIGQTSNVTVPTGTWQHLLATYDGSATSAGIKLYLDGELVSSTAGSSGSFTALNNTASALMIGANIDSTGNNANRFWGQIDDVRIYNYELTAQQIKLLYNENSAVRFE